MEQKLSKEQIDEINELNNKTIIKINNKVRNGLYGESIITELGFEIPELSLDILRYGNKLIEICQMDGRKEV